MNVYRKEKVVRIAYRYEISEETLSVNCQKVVMVQRKTAKNIVLFLVGYCAYIAIEVTYRGISYPVMGICGGAAIVLLNEMNNRILRDTDILLQGILGSALITTLELVIGEISLRTGLLPVMWDYSNVWANYDGVICLPFSLIWILLSIMAIILADSINYYVFNDNQAPYYKLFGQTFFPFRKK